LLGVARPGQTLTLSARAESIEEDAVDYNGQATVEGVPIVRLHHCVGPMVALEDFDDAEAVRGRFELLQTTGAEPGRFRGLPHLPLDYETNGATPAHSAILQVPATGDFFADHFPRRPVFPGSLLMHSNLELAARFAAQLPGLTPRGSWQPAAIANMKLRAFIPPGEPIRIEVSVENSGSSSQIAVECRNARRLTGSAHVLMTWKEEP
jgi:3-hydroxyacyl-[acyl-carrier-protein] dehydratase